MMPKTRILATKEKAAYRLHVNLENNATAFTTAIYTYSDSNSDGVLNSHQTDSDSDSCTDAIEGGVSFVSGDLDANGRLTGGVDGNYNVRNMTQGINKDK